jgi:hypothetical protein
LPQFGVVKVVCLADCSSLEAVVTFWADTWPIINIERAIEKINTDSFFIRFVLEVIRFYS